jgi:site-specific recombinase XerD
MPNVQRMREEPQKRPEFFSEEELKLIFSYHKKPSLWKRYRSKEEQRKRYEHLFHVWIALYSTGMRKGELCNLEWDDVDLEKGIIKIRIKNDWTPKWYHERDIPITPQFKETFMHRQKLKQSKRYVFTHPTGRKYSGDDIYNPLRSMLSDLDLKGNTHKFRHTYASHHVMNGTSIRALKELLGHRDIKETMKYAHLAPDYVQKQGQNLPDFR